MRKALSCVLMITLLLSGCRPAGAGETPEDAALALRETYQALAGWSASVDVSVCYTDTVYDFSLDAQWRRDGETVLTVTACMEQIEQGWMAQCAWAGENGEHLQISFRDPEQEDNAGTQFLLTFDRAGYALLSAEVSAQGQKVLSAQFSNFTMELKQDDTKDDP